MQLFYAELNILPYFGTTCRCCLVPLVVVAMVVIAVEVLMEMWQYLAMIFFSNLWFTVNLFLFVDNKICLTVINSPYREHEVVVVEYISSSMMGINF